MTVRELRESDISTLRKWHSESGFPYPFPDLLTPEFVRVVVVADEHDRPVQAFAARQMVELFMLADPEWSTPRARLAAIQMAHESMRVWLAEHGWNWGCCWLPPQVQKAFGKRLNTVFGWFCNTWISYSRSTAQR